MEIWEPKPPGTLRATPGLLRDSFAFLYDTLTIRVKLNGKLPTDFCFYSHIQGRTTGTHLLVYWYIASRPTGDEMALSTISGAFVLSLSLKRSNAYEESIQRPPCSIYVYTFVSSASVRTSKRTLTQLLLYVKCFFGLSPHPTQ